MAPLKRSFKFAKRGLIVAVRRERNIRVHLTIAGIVMICALLGRVEAWAWVCLILCCGMVLAAEFVNTAIETLCDRVQPSIDPHIRDCKDIAAGCVLLCAALSVAVGCVIFLRPSVLRELAGRPFELAVLALVCPFLLYYSRGVKK
ncbi:MAG: diacylglycerol kinase family protein [Oscillospiraceae bacterium]|nr:diacylglycerol kinase family protein [Oscillospiraceae bacterium]